MSTSPRNKEYTPPTAARCKEDAERIKRETEAFLAKGGSVTPLSSNIISTPAHQRAEAKRFTARKRGKSKMKGAAA